MILISRDEAEMLRSNGREFDVHISSKTHKSKAKKYYATESKQSMFLIEKYRQSKLQA